jgi:hypothetical protein
MRGELDQSLQAIQEKAQPEISPVIMEEADRYPAAVPTTRVCRRGD